MTNMKTEKKLEHWTIQIGNEAQVTREIGYTGTEIGAVRRFNKECKSLEENESSADLRRPGCRVLRTFKQP